jgi:hypothetical protein
MLFVLSSRPFTNFLQRGWLSTSILLKQIEHGPSLLFAKPLFRVADNIVVGSFIRHGTTPSLGRAQRTDLKLVEIS